MVKGVKTVAKEGVTTLKNKAPSLVRQGAEYYTRKEINDFLNNPGKEPTTIKGSGLFIIKSITRSFIMLNTMMENENTSFAKMISGKGSKYYPS